jgi:predicted transposase/invertase (TIGR01784 family)
MAEIDRINDKFWHEKGFTGEKDKILFFLTYISETKDIDPEELKKILEDTKIRGGDFMPTLAQRLRDEGKQEGVKVGKLETAKELLKNGVDINIIARATGFSREEIEKLVDKAH